MTKVDEISEKKAMDLLAKGDSILNESAAGWYERIGKTYQCYICETIS